MPIVNVFTDSSLKTPLEPGERAKENPGKSVSCLSGVKRSELNATRIFQASERALQGGFLGCLFFGDFFFAQKESPKKLLAQELSHQGCVSVAGEEAVMVEQLVEKIFVRCQAVDDGLVKHPAHPAQSPVPAGVVGNELDQQGIVIRGDDASGEEVRVHPGARTARQPQLRHGPGGGHEVLGRIFRIDAAFNGMPRGYNG
jgi:hypothetical protein